MSLAVEQMDLGEGRRRRRKGRKGKKEGRKKN